MVAFQSNADVFAVIHLMHGDGLPKPDEGRANNPADRRNQVAADRVGCVAGCCCGECGEEASLFRTFLGWRAGTRLILAELMIRSWTGPTGWSLVVMIKVGQEGQTY